MNDFDVKRMRAYATGKKKEGEAFVASTPLKTNKETIKDFLRNKEVVVTIQASIPIGKKSQVAATGTSSKKARTDGVDNTSLLMPGKDKGVVDAKDNNLFIPLYQLKKSQTMDDAQTTLACLKEATTSADRRGVKKKNMGKLDGGYQHLNFSIHLQISKI